MKRALAFGLMLALSACAGTPHGGYRPVSDTPARIGKPYSVHGQTYVPAAQPYYDALGYASWYGPESGGATANGEHFRPDGISAAHTTLPLPTYVEVTALETGRVIIVRVNDRGPFAAGGRIIDLSRGAARLLGMAARGKAPVRVRVVNPDEADRAALRAGHPAAARRNLSANALADLRARWAARSAPTSLLP